MDNTTEKVYNLLTELLADQYKVKIIVKKKAENDTESIQQGQVVR